MAVQDNVDLAVAQADRPGTNYVRWLEQIPAAYWVVGAVLLFMPAVANDFWLFQVWGWAFILGMIALSLMFLGGYGGMVSLAQMTIAAVGGYMVAILGTSSVDAVSLGWPLWLAVIVAIIVAMLFGTATGALAVRTRGIYTIMITLAVAAGFFYFTRQNYTIFNGYSGFPGIRPPDAFGIRWRAPIPFYYLTLACAVLSYLAVVYVSRSPFGLALQGIRDNPRRMSALGFNVVAHRIAAYSFASVIAAVGGILLVWQNAQISPGTAGIGPVIDILVIAIAGGLAHPIGPFIGALIYVVLRTFSPEMLVAVGLPGDRFQTLIGLGFLAVVFWSPDGVLGLWERFRQRFHTARQLARSGESERP
jgi:branched-chain amino acid transport system permease protein